MNEKFVLKGVLRDLYVYDNKVVLKDKKTKRGLGFWAAFIALTCFTLIGGIIFYFLWNVTDGKEKTIYLKNIKSMELKSPSSLVNGYIQFNVDGASDWQNDLVSENTFQFRGNDVYEQCVQVRDYIESVIA